MKYLMIGVVGLYSLGSFAQPDFTQKKQMMLNHFDEKEAIIQQARNCVNEAQTKDQLKECKQSMKQQKEELWDKKKEMKQQEEAKSDEKQKEEKQEEHEEGHEEN